MWVSGLDYYYFYIMLRYKAGAQVLRANVGGTAGFTTMCSRPSKIYFSGDFVFLYG